VRWRGGGRETRQRIILFLAGHTQHVEVAAAAWHGSARLLLAVTGRALKIIACMPVQQMSIVLVHIQGNTLRNPR
jgi:hypothetical protein